MKIRRRLVAVVRREAERFVALAAARRAVQAESRAEPALAPRFRPLTASEAEVVVGGDLVASLTDVIRS